MTRYDPLFFKQSLDKAFESGRQQGLKEMATPQTKPLNATEIASKILTQLGFSQEPSKEIGVDERRDWIVRLIEQYSTPQTRLSNEEIWNLSDMVLENSDVIGFARAIEERHGIK